MKHFVIAYGKQPFLFIINITTSHKNNDNMFLCINLYYIHNNNTKERTTLKRGLFRAVDRMCKYSFNTIETGNTVY